MFYAKVSKNQQMLRETFSGDPSLIKGKKQNLKRLEEMTYSFLLIMRWSYFESKRYLYITVYKCICI